MKEKILIFISLGLSIASIAYSIWIHHHAQEMAIAALHQRESEFVVHMTPLVEQNLMGTKSFSSPPKTLEELLRPLADILKAMVDPVDDSTTNKLAK